MLSVPRKKKMAWVVVTEATESGGQISDLYMKRITSTCHWCVGLKEKEENASQARDKI